LECGIGVNCTTCSADYFDSRGSYFRDDTVDYRLFLGSNGDHYDVGTVSCDLVNIAGISNDVRGVF